jgi:hypothetical protein
MDTLPTIMDPLRIPAGYSVRIFMLLDTGNNGCGYYTDKAQAQRALRWRNKNCGKGHRLLPMITWPHGAE